MKTDLSMEDMVVRITSPQIITQTEAGTPATGATPGAGPGVGAGAGAGCAATATAGAASAEWGRRLLLAARDGDTAAVCDLMARGAPFTTDWLGTSPLHLAALHAHAGTAAALLRAGVSRDARSKVERTPLHLAAHAGHGAVARVLLEHGAAPDPRDMLRMTPLHWAVERGHRDVARELLRRGADPRATSKFLKTPLSLALQAGDRDMLELLEGAVREREREREAAASVDALVTEQMTEETAAAPAPIIEAVQIQNTQFTKPIKVKPVQIHQERSIPKTETKTESGDGGGGGGDTAAARLLRAHGIALQPPDAGGTVLSALQSGRSVVLSDAGKLMLKESNPPGAGSAGAGGAGGAAGAARVFALGAGGRLRALGKPALVKPALVKRVISPRDLHQVKYVQLPADSRVVRTTRMRTAGGGGGGAVKILFNKANFSKLIAGAAAAPAPATAPAPAHAPAPAPVGPETVETSADADELRAQLRSARAALALAAAQLRACRARLARYEPAPPAPPAP